MITVVTCSIGGGSTAARARRREYMTGWLEIETMRRRGGGAGSQLAENYKRGLACFPYFVLAKR